jgi:hypothetical protein
MAFFIYIYIYLSIYSLSQNFCTSGWNYHLHASSTIRSSIVKPPMLNRALDCVQLSTIRADPPGADCEPWIKVTNQSTSSKCKSAESFFQHVNVLVPPLIEMNKTAPLTSDQPSDWPLHCFNFKLLPNAQEKYCPFQIYRNNSWPSSRPHKNFPHLDGTLFSL